MRIEKQTLSYMKKFLLAYAAVAAMAAPAAAQDLQFLVSTQKQGFEIVGFTEVVEGQTYDVPVHVEFDGVDMWEVHGDLYVKAVNGSSAEVVATIKEPVIESNNNVSVPSDIMLQTCFGGLCQGGDVTATLAAGQSTSGSLGEHIGYSGTVFDQATADAMVFDITYAVNVTMGSDFAKKFYIHFLSENSSVGSVDVAGAEKEYSNLQGMRISQPRKGEVYILRQGSKVSKQLF